MAFSLFKTLMRPEPGTREWKDRVIDGASDLPDLEGYVSNDAVAIVEYILVRDPIQLLRVARTEEAILTEVRERLYKDREKASLPPTLFHFNEVPIRTTGDCALACGSWDAFCDAVAGYVRSNTPGSDKLLEHVASLVPAELRHLHRRNMRARLSGEAA